MGKILLPTDFATFGFDPSLPDDLLQKLQQEKKDASQQQRLQKVFDLHCDTLDRLAARGNPSVLPEFAAHDALLDKESLSSLSSNAAHVSLDQTKNFAWTQCFAIFVPDALKGKEAWDFYQFVYSFFQSQLEEHEERIVQVRNMAERNAALEAGRTAAFLSVEGASFFEDDYAFEPRLETLLDNGVSLMTLTWNAENALGSGVGDWGGLTPFGKMVVSCLDQKEVTIDVSHLNDEGFTNLCEIATRPFIASHSNARAVCDHPRNLADWQLHEMRERQGLVGLNFCPAFISALHTDPTPEDVLRMVDHLLEVAGEDVPALGSDYDGTDVPSWLQPCSQMKELYALLAKEFGKEIADKIFFQNAENFFERMEKKYPYF